MPILKNIRHEKLAQALASGMSQMAAYVEAGYSAGGAKPNASRMAGREDIKARVEGILLEKEGIDGKATQKAVEALAITRQDVLRELWDNAMRGKAAVPVLDHKGKESGEYRADLSASNKALELFGKEAHRMFVERRETGKPGEFENLSDAELDAEIKACRAIMDASDAAKATGKQPVTSK